MKIFTKPKSDLTSEEVVNEIRSYYNEIRKDFPHERALNLTLLYFSLEGVTNKNKVRNIVGD